PPCARRQLRRLFAHHQGFSDAQARLQPAYHSPCPVQAGIPAETASVKPQSPGHKREIRPRRYGAAATSGTIGSETAFQTGSAGVRPARGAARATAKATGLSMRSVIFDLDGTLADTAADLLAAANHAFEKAGHGHPLTAKDAPVAGFGSRAMLRRGSEILNLGWGESDLDRWQPVLLEAYEADICRETRFFPEAVETIEALKR